MDTRAKRRRPGAVEERILQALTAVILGVALAPVLAVVVISFTSASTLEFPPPGWSFRWYAATWGLFAGADSDFSRLGESLATSLAIALATGLICVLCGVPAAYALTRTRFVGKRLVDQLVSLPVVFPAVVLAVALLVMVSEAGLDLGLFRIAIAHTVILLPFMIRNCIAALQGQDPALEEAAKTLGASPLRCFAEVVLPLMRSGILSGFLIVFIMSLNEFTLTYFLFTVDVFPVVMWMFQESSANMNPSIFAVSTLLIALNVGVILIADRTMGGKGPAP